ncbi:ABC transporter ATP-binding protein [Cupriavidus pauculus]|uniref:ABC transporter ATP-binding protein n=1 Tax=Cupriavidus pauculus TaxID=82633 RepID=A0A5P2HDN2_9BURK|nr:ABC transporter ATP-binding protein [Cupriavidus pauculus]QET06377.1 ABC transporter ATP-binding protein [Cupriavidus pauculus]
MSISHKHDAAALLRVNGLSVQFGGTRALDAVSFAMKPRTVCGIIGPNGAGKTTLFNCLSRLCNPDTGTIHFAERDITTLAPEGIAAAGIARTFQNVALFDRQTVRANVEAGCYRHVHGGTLSHLFGLRRASDAMGDIRARVGALLDMTRLADIADRLVADLSFGTRKRVELARALAMEPRLLLLDEPAAGLNFEEVGELEAWIRHISRELGIAVLLIEHHMNLVMRVSDQVIGLEFGRVMADGTPHEVANHPEVIRAYLGDHA